MAIFDRSNIRVVAAVAGLCGIALALSSNVAAAPLMTGGEYTCVQGAAGQGGGAPAAAMCAASAPLAGMAGVPMALPAGSLRLRLCLRLRRSLWLRLYLRLRPCRWFRRLLSCLQVRRWQRARRWLQAPRSLTWQASGVRVRRPVPRRPERQCPVSRLCRVRPLQARAEAERRST